MQFKINAYFSNQNCFPFRTEVLQFTIIIIMRTGLPSNPFLRDNPFYIPQKFYSQNNSQENPLRKQSATRNGNFPNISIGSKGNFSYGDIIKHSILLKKERQQNEKSQKLLQKGLNRRQSPFTRKNLLQNNYLNVQNSTEKVQYLGLPQGKGQIWNVQQKDMKENMLAPEQIIKSPKVKQLQINQEMSSPNKQKYLSSQLKLKLKSQTYIQQNVGEALTDQKTNKMKDSTYYPHKFKWKGKDFFLRQIL